MNNIEFSNDITTLIDLTQIKHKKHRNLNVKQSDDVKHNKMLYDMYKDNIKCYTYQGGIKKFNTNIAEQLYISNTDNITVETLPELQLNNIDETSSNNYGNYFDNVNINTNKGENDYYYDVEYLINDNKHIYVDRLNEYWNYCLDHNYKKCGLLYIWLTAYIERNNITICKQHITYNERHYAVRNHRILNDDGCICDIYDYIKFTNTGKVLYYNGYISENANDKKRTGDNDKTISDLIKMYFNLFYNMNIKDKELLFVHILYLLYETANLNTWLCKNTEKHNTFSPKILMDKIDFLMNKKCNYGICDNKVSNKCKKIYYEPGYENEAKLNLKEDIDIAYKDKIYESINELRNVNEEISNKSVKVYMDNSKYKITDREYKRICKKFNIEFDKVVMYEKVKKVDENNEQTFDNNEFKYDTSKFEYVEKTRKQQDRSKRKQQDRSKRKQQDRSKRKQQDRSKRKQQDRSKRKQHKQQDRSLWHIMVKEGKSYEEIIKTYPNVSKGAYIKYKQRLNK